MRGTLTYFIIVPGNELRKVWGRVAEFLMFPKSFRPQTRLVGWDDEEGVALRPHVRVVYGLHVSRS